MNGVLLFFADVRISSQRKHFRIESVSRNLTQTLKFS